jgi:hypothetical protein
MKKTNATAIHTSAIVWSKAIIYLDTLSFAATGDLKVTFPERVPRGNLVSLDEAFYGDIVTGHPYVEHCPECIYLIPFGDSYTTVEKKWKLASTGSGNLEIRLDFHWELNAIPSYMPIGVAAGPDNVFIDVFVNDVLMNHYQLNPNIPTFIDSSLSPIPNRHFGNGQINSLRIVASTLVNGGWKQKP